MAGSRGGPADLSSAARGALLDQSDLCYVFASVGDIPPQQPALCLGNITDPRTYGYERADLGEFKRLMQ